MTVSAGLLLTIFSILIGLLLVVALVHIIQGLRFSGGSRPIVTSTVLFLLGILIVTSATYVVLRPVDWHGTLTISLPFTTTSQPQ